MKRRKQTAAQRRAIIKAGPWEMKIRKSRFKALRGDARFHHVIALARLMNSIRFANSALEEAFGKSGFSNRRQLLCSTFLLGALLWEGRELRNGIGKCLDGCVSWQDFRNLFNGSGVRDLFDKNLGRLRNKATFHVDADEIRNYVQAETSRMCLSCSAVVPRWPTPTTS